MPVYWSRTLIPTARQAPGEAVVPSHVLMLRAGLIRQLGAGMYSYLPLGLRALRKAMAIVRQEMDAAGAVEVFLPAIQPIELWERTGRRAAYGENLFVVKDRHGRELALGPTHEEVMTELVKGTVESYRQLPITLYQIQTKFRDEYRPRFGVLRSREFQMKDAYSFDLTVEGLDKSYQAMYDAYRRIFDRCGLPYEIVEAESGPIGGSASHEFMVPSPTGEDVILKSDKGNYAANVEKCEIGTRPVSPTLTPFSRDPQGSASEGHEGTKAQRHEGSEPTGELEKVHTPECASIEDVCDFFKKNLKTKLKPQNMLKTLVFEVFWETDRSSVGDAWVMTVVRGDHDVNEGKVRSLLGRGSDPGLRFALADEQTARAVGIPIGFVGPHALAALKCFRDVRPRSYSGPSIIVDADAAQDGYWVTGANEVDHHIKHFSWKRDVINQLGDEASRRVLVADIRNAVDGDPSPRNDGGVLRETKGIEIGHVFKLGTKYPDALDLRVLDEKNERRSVIMGCYGIGVNRILAAAIEREGGNDDNGIIWPASIAPFAVLITPIKYEGAVKETADALAAALEGEHGLDVLIDDRDERPGVKFKDADLIGVPVRITIGDKALAAPGGGNVEVKPRTADKATLVPIADAARQVAELIAGMMPG